VTVQAIHDGSEWGAEILRQVKTMVRCGCRVVPGLESNDMPFKHPSQSETTRAWVSYRMT
jgi:hypothetical protein